MNSQVRGRQSEAGEGWTWKGGRPEKRKGPYKEFGLLIKKGNGLRSEVESGGTKMGKK